MKVCHRALSATSVSKCCSSKSDAVLMSGDEVPYGGNHGIGRFFHEPVARAADNLAADVRRDEFGLLAAEGAAGLLARQDEQRHGKPRAAHAGEVLRITLEIAKVLEACPHRPGLCVRPGVKPATGLGHGALAIGGEVVPEMLQVDALAPLHQ